MAAPVAAASPPTFAESANATSRTINKPTSTASGDLLVLIVSIDATATITMPAGFTALMNQLEPSSTMSLAISWRIADGTEGSTFTVTSTSEIANGVIIRVTGAAATAPIDAMSIWAGEVNAIRSAGVIPTLQAYSACSAGALILQVLAIDDGTTSISATPSGHTSITTLGASSSGTKLAVYEKSLSAEGYAGLASWTINDDTEAGFSVTLVIRASTATNLPAQPVMRCMNVLHQPSGIAATLLKPYGTVDNDLLVLVQSGKVVSTLTPPGAFTSIYDTNNAGAIYHQAYQRIASSEGASYSVASSTAAGPICTMMRFTGAATSSPIDTSSSSTGSSATPTAPTITPAAANCFILYTEGNDDDEVTTNSGFPSGYTGIYAESNDDGTDCGIILAFVTQTTATATGTAAGSYTASEEWVAGHIAIKPAAGGTTTPQAVAATAVGVATIRVKVKKNVAATALVAPTMTRKTKKTLAATALCVATVKKKVKKTLAATAVVVGTMTMKRIYRLTVAATAVGVATMTTRIRFAKALAATALVVATMSQKMTYRRTLAATAVGVATMKKKVKKTLAATCQVTPLMTKKVKKPLAATAVGTATIADRLVFKRTLSVTVVAVGTMSETFQSGTPKFVQDWIDLWIPYKR